MADQNKVEFLPNLIEKIINVKEICRFCLSDTKSNITINDKCPSDELKESGGDSIFNFVTKFNFVKVEGRTNFPMKVCENCYSVVKICNDFSQLCQKSDTLLKNYYDISLKQPKTTLIKEEKPEIKIAIQIPNTQQPVDMFLNYDDVSTEILKVNKPEIKIVGACSQLHSLSAKLKEAQLKLPTESPSVVRTDQYGCTRCSLTFSSVRALNCHNVVMHSQKRFRTLFKFQCKNCPKLFSDQTKLVRHYRIIHKVSRSELSDEVLSNQVSDEKFVCCHCDPRREFKYRSELVEHLKFHELEVEDEGIEDLSHLKLKNLINVLDSVVDSLTIAQQEKQSGFRLLCKNCNPSLGFASTGDFIQHINTHHGGLKLLQNWVIEHKAKKDGSWCCAECPASYTRKQSLYCHMREKHGQTIIDAMKCPESGCSESFNTNRQLIQHGIVVHQKYFAYFHKVFKKVLQTNDEEDQRVKNFECDICQKKYFYKTSLRKHIFSSHLGKSVKDPVVCTYCGKTLSSKLNLKSHIEFVHEALFVSCPICKKKINFRTVGKHYKTHKTNSMVYSKNSFLCNLCGKILKSKRSFEDHQKLHKNIRDELCDICGSGFTTKKFLRLHKKTHEGIQRKMFTCDQCDKVFSGRQTLNRHLLTHSGKKNFICEICSKCFYTLQELNRHVRYHKKEYRYDCQLCDMRFLDKSRFRHHMMRHRNVRPHKCQFCEKMFIVRGKMNLHMAAKHNVEVENRKGIWKDPKTYVPLDDLL